MTYRWTSARPQSPNADSFKRTRYQACILATGVLLGVEPSGRLVVIEIKLARNAEARCAAVAQVLTYAAHLKGLDPTVLEGNFVDGYLPEHEHESFRDAVAAED